MKVSQDGQTALETKLDCLAILIGYVGLAVGTLTFVVLSVRFCIEKYPNRGWDKDDFSEFLDFFIICITVLVVAIPKGLPLAVTLALPAFSMKRMLKENNLVCHLHACKTMGSATVICNNKTGTLTTNSMTVVKANICQTELKQKLGLVCAHEGSDYREERSKAEVLRLCQLSQADGSTQGCTICSLSMSTWPI
ncbi:hypothetical protein SARC_01323 [Sphaeroforma arctica JP610]|uniref:Cation-transporting P-type ATPase C-terminal domain-containing protein n=1 Tax=Sphaeroforma arctica JP610 TaxID=667725 RepID=A0A0L0GC28_9EUKA|nr:hypothetical protein SARC_01323 [Sphaeroforma arctica JP610]KNC86550.1 hypothetical protein SARC_01323 [Sphaeroforma arctica JP610]|eukprot:XP_014160452.1 hypothetical protein SARC_01323 [Sphaeroforma arctica JP610]